MDIWEKLYEKAKAEYHPEDVTPFVMAHHVVCAVEAENGGETEGMNQVRIRNGYCTVSHIKLKARHKMTTGGDWVLCRHFFCYRGLKPRIFIDWDVRGRAISGRGNPFFMALPPRTRWRCFIMSKANSQRKSCKDVFNAFLVTMATYAGFFEFPRIRPTYDIPNRLIVFSKTLSCKDYNQWVHFYEDDHLFERIWRHPRKYLEILKRYNGVVLPDFSLYRDMPLVMQLWNIYRSRAIGHWLQINGIKIIPNIRYGDRRTYHICCDGIEKHCVIAVGSHGNLKHKADREIFLAGFDVIIKLLQPSAVVIYGSAPEKYFQKYIDDGIRIIVFESDYSASHKEVE